jgi:hypothetical protein
MLLQFVLTALCLVLGFVSAQNPTVYIIRHGEKPANKDDHGLTLDGIKRAQCLRSVFGERSGYNIGQIIAPHVRHGKFRAFLVNIKQCEVPRRCELLIEFVNVACWLTCDVVYRWRARPCIPDCPSSRK